MTAAPIKPLLLLAMLGGLTAGCGRSSLLGRGAGGSPETHTAISTSTTTSTGGTTTSPSTSQPTMNGVCPAGLTACGRGAATRCHDLTRSPEHCGQCGNACAPGISCESSRCRQYACKGALTFKAMPGIPTTDYTANGYWDRLSSYHPVLGDFDRDGTLDWVGPPGIDTPMGVLLGQGDGTFQPHPIAPAFVGFWKAAAADLNGDGWLDLATIAKDQAEVSVRLGNGDPATLFASASSYVAPSPPESLVLADLDDDGQVDMVAAAEKQLLLWRGAASGRLAELVRIPVGGNASLLLAKDWNGDGVLDLLFGTSTLRMLLGHGDGTFDDEIACGLRLGDSWTGSGVFADLDHDHKLDMVVRSTGVLLGMNGCNFTTLVSIPDWRGGGIPESVGVADLDGDGHADLVSASSASVMDARLSVYLGDGRGGFAAPLDFPSIGIQMGGAYLMGDLDRDTKLDIIVARQDGWRVLLNTCH
jgi:hypothetical protein